MTEDVKAVKSDAKSDTRTNVTLSALAATALMRYLEAHYGIKVSADDALEYVCAGLAGWHVLVTTCGPYASRVFDHFFPPPAQPAQQQETMK